MNTNDNFGDLEGSVARVVGTYISVMSQPQYIQRKQLLRWIADAGFRQEHADLVPDLYAILATNSIQQSSILLRAIETYVSDDGNGGYVRDSISPRNTTFVYAPKKYLQDASQNKNVGGVHEGEVPFMGGEA